MAEMNGEPTESVSTPELVVNGGDNAMLFEDLMSVEKHHADAKSDERKAARQEKAKEKAKDEPKKDNKSDKKAASKEAPKDSEDHELSQEDDVEPSEADPKSETAKLDKKIKAVDGDQNLDLSLTTKIPVKVDGVETSATLAELRDNYAGKVNWDKKNSELGRQKLEFTQSKEQIENQFKSFFKKSETDPLNAFFEMAEHHGYDSIKMQKDFFNSLIPAIEKYHALSDDERKHLELEQTNAQLKKRLETREQAEQEQQVLTRLQASVSNLQETHKISSEQFAEAFWYLEGLQKQGKIKDEITPDLVAQFVNHERLFQTLDQTFNDLKLSMTPEERKAALDELMSFAEKDKTLTPSDIKDIAIQVYGKDKAKNLSRKIAQAKGERVNKQASKKSSSSNEPMFFDDIL